MTALRIHLYGSDTARFGDLEANSIKSPIGVLARKMAGAGIDATQLVDVWRNETLCFTAAPLQFWADRTTSETDSHSVRHTKWQAMPKTLHAEAPQ